MQSQQPEKKQTGKIQLTPDGWNTVEAKINELRRTRKGWADIADAMGLSMNTLRILRAKKSDYRTNLTVLQDIFKIFELGESPEQIVPEEGKHYERVLEISNTSSANVPELVDIIKLTGNTVRSTVAQLAGENPHYRHRKYPHKNVHQVTTASLVKLQEAIPASDAVMLFFPDEPRHFYGREQEVQILYERFLVGRRSQAIVGLPGVGKTQLAHIYALNFRSEYKFILWIDAQTEAAIHQKYVEVARMLGLIKDEAQEQANAVEAVLEWLTNSDCLLVVDGADAPNLLRNYLPRNPRGHVLLTTRADNLNSLNVNELLSLGPLSWKAALKFLLDRCNRLDASVDEREAANELAHQLGYFPLAMAQAAAYIAYKETTFKHYLELFRRRKLALLEDSSISDIDEPLKPLKSTWEAKIQALEAHREAGKPGAYAWDLLNFCAFISGDDISCQLILSGAKEYCPPLYNLIPKPQDNTRRWEFCSVEEEAIYHDLLQPLLRASLIQKSLEAPPRFSVHPILQMVIADRLGNKKREWQEKAVRAVDGMFPVPEAANWQTCDRLLPHAIAVADMVRQEGLMIQEAGRLLCNLGEFLMFQGRYAHAALYARYGLTVREQFASAHPASHEHQLDLALNLQCLGNVCHHQRHLEEAEDLLKRALSIRQRPSGEVDPETLNVGNDLAAVYNSQGRFSQAESVYLNLLEKADIIRADGASITSPDQKATIRHNLGNSYYWQRRFEEAVRWYKAALQYWAEVNAGNHPGHADTWHDLAQAYRLLDRAEAEDCYKEALKIQQAAYPQGHARTAVTLYNLAELYKDTNRYNQAEAYYKEAAREDGKVVGEIHADVIFDLKALAELYRLMGRLADAEAVQQGINDIAQKLAEAEQA